jgi:hypothetical protein
LRKRHDDNNNNDVYSPEPCAGGKIVLLLKDKTLSDYTYRRIDRDDFAITIIEGANSNNIVIWSLDFMWWFCVICFYLHPAYRMVFTPPA